MFILRRKRFIARHSSPIIGQNLGLGASDIHHRFNREKHALFQNRARARTPVMQNIRRRMKHPPQTMPAKIAHHAHAVPIQPSRVRSAEQPPTRRRAGVKAANPLAQHVLSALQNDEIASDDLLPNSGVGLALERLLSPAFITSPSYGTRTSTVVIIEQESSTTHPSPNDKAQKIFFHERQYQGDKNKFKECSYTICQP